jgi:hypothetical protein
MREPGCTCTEAEIDPCCPWHGEDWVPPVPPPLWEQACNVPVSWFTGGLVMRTAQRAHVWRERREGGFYCEACTVIRPDERELVQAEVEPDPAMKVYRNAPPSGKGALERVKAARDWAATMAEREAGWKVTEPDAFHAIADRIVAELDDAIGLMAEAVKRLDILADRVKDVMP